MIPHLKSGHTIRRSPHIRTETPVLLPEPESGDPGIWPRPFLPTPRDVPLAQFECFCEDNDERDMAGRLRMESTSNTNRASPAAMTRLARQDVGTSSSRQLIDWKVEGRPLPESAEPVSGRVGASDGGSSSVQ